MIGGGINSKPNNNHCFININREEKNMEIGIKVSKQPAQPKFDDFQMDDVN